MEEAIELKRRQLFILSRQKKRQNEQWNRIGHYADNDWKQTNHHFALGREGIGERGEGLSSAEEVKTQHPRVFFVLLTARIT